MMMTPQDVIADFIAAWEGGMSLNRSDTGNWVNGQLIGSKYGVTAQALASYRKVDVHSISQAVMRALDIDEAADIAIAKYFNAPRLNQLVWNRVTASLLDMGWGAGPRQAIKLLQRMIGVADDGIIGPATAGAFEGYLLRHGEAPVADEWAFVRINFYIDITETRPANLKFLNGWTARTAYFTQSPAIRNKGWWQRFGQ